MKMVDMKDIIGALKIRKEELHRKGRYMMSRTDYMQAIAECLNENGGLGFKFVGVAYSSGYSEGASFLFLKDTKYYSYMLEYGNEMAKFQTPEEANKYIMGLGDIHAVITLPGILDTPLYIVAKTITKPKK